MTQMASCFARKALRTIQRKSIIDTYATIDTFTSKWQETKKKSDIAEMLKESGIDLAVLKHDQDMDDVDDFDFICHIAYGKKHLHGMSVPSR